jgi:antitoxin HigA-1
MRFKNGMPPIHPGEILREDWLIPLDMSASALAAALEVPPNRITQIVAEKRDITADTALRLSCVLGTTAEFWMNVQKTYELRKAAIESEAALRKRLKPLPYVAKQIAKAKAAGGVLAEEIALEEARVEALTRPRKRSA